MVLRVFHGWIRAATTREFIKEEKRDSRRWLFKESILQYLTTTVCRSKAIMNQDRNG